MIMVEVVNKGFQEPFEINRIIESVQTAMENAGYQDLQDALQIALEVQSKVLDKDVVSTEVLLDLVMERLMDLGNVYILKSYLLKSLGVPG
ncbi:putative transcriptional regulator, Zn-ribbon, ATP-cone family [Aeromonas phage LAh_8]|uniref:Putative transcriptional regulator, Zn-ribbon, ATP-cone family n=2 Tax=Lahexavirus TaxID=2843411 RepID=A0A513ZZY0_9CAUD|nr:putative transcriptional regulator, Zn-ribbon, ATP-cone family [Aeromonas phage LAh_6]YP_009847462.1 putative transcriptional regulator, Zn-ribbon, ATP-cone family [Aeromonas phage LAh_8]QDH46579.1 putative transcriptional regulator, Zn-ribbon, ATP-cone family [Aeromonas phage LAh_6]QDH46816.1 putative transcriptional regulator, Zn-ribbon, ATP-cone family [Aeromonas phage LAh_8]